MQKCTRKVGECIRGRAHSAWKRLKRVLLAYLVWSAAYLLLEAAAGVSYLADSMIPPVDGVLCGRGAVPAAGGEGDAAAFPLCMAGTASAAAVLGTAKLQPVVRALSLRPDITAYALTSFLLLWPLCSLPRDVPRHARAVSRLSFGLYLSHLLVLRLWIEWTTRRPKVMYLRFGQLWLLVFAGGLLIASVLAILPHGSLLGGAPCKNTKQTEGQNGEKT